MYDELQSNAIRESNKKKFIREEKTDMAEGERERVDVMYEDHQINIAIESKKKKKNLIMIEGKTAKMKNLKKKKD